MCEVLRHPHAPRRSGFSPSPHSFPAGRGGRAQGAADFAHGRDGVLSHLEALDLPPRCLGKTVAPKGWHTSGPREAVNQAHDAEPTRLSSCSCGADSSAEKLRERFARFSMHQSSASWASLNLRQLDRILPPAFETSVASGVPCTQNRVCPETLVVFIDSKFHSAGAGQVEARAALFQRTLPSAPARLRACLTAQVIDQPQGTLQIPSFAQRPFRRGLPAHCA